MYIVQYPVYNAQRIIFKVQCKNEQCTMGNVQCTLYDVHCSKYNV